ncbi:MAG: DUF1848 family protein [Candidatus Eisenbacteria bacterium]|nr:DUF1848 family protein [Candidatus Eisenbacteria bacterium]
MTKVVSASRRVDMVGSYPDELKELLTRRARPEETHTVVIWTKDPSNIFRDAELYRILRSYEQVYFHHTITGLGGSFLEPQVPHTATSLSLVRKLAEFAGKPERVALRFDPIVRFRAASGEVLTNLEFFESIARTASDIGIRQVFTSWVSSYGKVTKRLEKLGLECVQLSALQFQAESAQLEEKAKEIGVELLYCCVPGKQSGKCIDGERLKRLHPRREECSTLKAKGQRELCECTDSLDIGWYKLCRHGCLYCYGSPDIRKARSK